MKRKKLKLSIGLIGLDHEWDGATGGAWRAVALPQFYQTPVGTEISMHCQRFHNIHDLLFSFFSQYDRFCPLKFFDTTHCRYFGSTSSPPPAIFSGANSSLLWY